MQKFCVWGVTLGVVYTQCALEKGVKKQEMKTIFYTVVHIIIKCTGLDQFKEFLLPKHQNTPCTNIWTV